MRDGVAGLEGTLRAGEDEVYRALLAVLDGVFSAAVVTPAVVTFWRSVWELMGLYVYPDNELYGALISAGIGVFGHLLFALSQHYFEYFHPDRNRVLYYVVSRFYTMCFAFVCVNGWRGPWTILDLYTEKDFTTVMATTVVGVVALAAIRALRNVSAPPCSLVTDHVQGYFEVVTMFRVTVRNNSIFNCLLFLLITFKPMIRFRKFLN